MRRRNLWARYRKLCRLLKPMTIRIEDPAMRSVKAEDEEYDRTMKEIAGKDIYPELMRIFEKTVKEDRRSVEFIFTHLLSAYTPDPSNLGMEAPTSEGKTYPTVEIAGRFPIDDVLFLGGLSPTALVHDHGELLDRDDRPIEPLLDSLRGQLRALKNEGKTADVAIVRDQIAEAMKGAKNLVNLENKILIFLEAPELETWARLRPILSHDRYEISYKFTDKPAKGQLRTSNVVIRGWPAVVYLKAERGREDVIWDQIQTRFTTISPVMTERKYGAAISLTAERKGLPSIVFEKKLGVEEFEWAERVIRTIRRRLMEITYKARKSSRAYNPNIFWIPFYDEIGKEFPTKFGRHMRDSARFLTLMQMSAATNFFARPILKIGDVEYIVVVREDYERAVRLFFEEAGEEIFTGLPAHVIRFFKEIVIPLKSEKEAATISDMVEKCAKKYEKPKSAQAIRQGYVHMLAQEGYITGEPDPNDSRRKLWRVLQEDLIPKDTEIYRVFEKGGIFTPQMLKARLEEFRQITKQELQIHYDNSSITPEQLWDKFYSRCVIRLRPSQPETEKSAKENTEAAGKGVNFGISQQKGPVIEKIEEPAESVAKMGAHRG